jgi:OOP family OmpA-OmpF porin
VSLRASSDREGSIELTAGAGLFVVNQALLSQSTPQRFMIGGEVRAAYNFSRHLGLSLGTARGNGGGTLLNAPFGAATFTFDLNRTLSPFIEIGGGLTRFSADTGALFGGAGDSVTAAFSSFGGLGVRLMIGERFALRVAGRMAYAKYNALDNGTVTLGLSYFLGGGSARDADAAGVPDRRDRFADPPAEVTMDASAGPVPRDTDNDGVTDDLDRCADTPADARPVGADGCPVPRDTDGDGVLDAGDRCPNTPAGSRVDATGCPPAEPAELPTLWVLPEVGQSLVLSAVQFAAAGSRLTAASRTVLDYIAAAIRAIPNSRWEVGGYTSATGTRADNLRLSRTRARAVVRYLISRGVAARALRAFGYGPANPAAPNNTADGRAQNRRVEIKRIQ